MRVCMCVLVCVDCSVFVQDYLYYMHYVGPVIINQFFK